MASVNRVYAARLAGMVVLGPDGESLGRVRDVVVSISIVRHQPRVLGLVVELLTRRRIFVPILRVTAIEPDAVTLTTGNVSLRRFVQRPGEVMVLGQILDTRVRVNDPEQEQLAGVDVVVVDLGIEQTRTRDWMVTRVAVRSQRKLGRRSAVVVVDWQNVAGLTPSGLAMPGQGVAQLLHQFEGRRPIEVADALRELPAKRRTEVIDALDDERLADVLQELPEDDQSELLRKLDTERAADVLEAMDPDDAADLLGVMNPTEAEALLDRMAPEDSESVRRLLSHSPDTAGGLMTSDPVVLAPDTTVAEALARARDPDLTPALASLVFVVRPPTATPTGRYLGCVHLQALLREPPAHLVSGIVDSDLPSLKPDAALGGVTRYFAAYNLVCGPVVDDEGHLLGAVTVDDVLDHLLPPDW
ncbi:MAG: CBS domain-containing protein, partial [Actinomycetota bacterium]|nr:CBS domain-containing protein [Actinomycetota bacterium]